MIFQCNINIWAVTSDFSLYSCRWLPLNTAHKGAEGTVWVSEEQDCRSSWNWPGPALAALRRCLVYRQRWHNRVVGGALHKKHVLKETKHASKASFITINTLYPCRHVTGVCASPCQHCSASSRMQMIHFGGILHLENIRYTLSVICFSPKNCMFILKRNSTHTSKRQRLYMKTFLYCDTEISNAIWFFTSV